MTVQTTSSKAGPFFGNGATLVWNSGFRVDQPADLRAIYTDTAGVETVLDPSAYIATGFGDPDGIGVTYPISGIPLSAAEKITLLRIVSYDQQTSITNQGGFYPQVIERALDRIVYQTQQIAEKLGRAITLSASSALSGLFLPDPESGKYLRGRADGTGYENADLIGSGSIGIPVSIAQGGTNATSISAARTSLGLGTAATLNAGTVVNNLVQLPSAGTLPALDATALTHTGKLIGITIYSMPGSYTYNKNPNAVRVEIELAAGGGQGGGTVATGTGTQTAGAGGSGGGYARRSLLNSLLAATTTVTVGVGGSTGGNGATGQNGGSSSFGALLSATGGTGGNAGLTPSNGTGANSSVTPTVGVGSSGDLNLSGGVGGPGLIFGASNPLSGQGGSSFFGFGGLWQINNADGVAAVNPGAGGGGSATGSTNVTRKGGAGASGMVIVREYDA